MKKLSLLLTSAMLLTFTAFNVVSAAEADAEDTENPGNVTGVELTALDGAIKVTWEETTDNVAVEGYRVFYGTQSVENEGETYETFEDAGNVTEYTIEGLENGTEYFVAVVAYDAADLESVKWSLEQSAIAGNTDENAGSDAEDDGENPQVVSAEAINSRNVKVVFSEAVMLPSENPQNAFSIENEDSFEPLVVEMAEIDPDITDGTSIMLMTAEQEAGANYKLTAGVEIEDMFENPVSSGTSDTAFFSGSDIPYEEPSTDTEGPKMLGVEVVDEQTIIVEFDETIVLSANVDTNFRILSDDESATELTITNVQLGQNTQGIPESAVIIQTEPHQGGNYVVVASDIQDESGNVISAQDASQSFQGAGTAPEDNSDQEPEEEDNMDEEEDNMEDETDNELSAQDVANFIANRTFEAGNYFVTLSWSLPTEQATNILEQVIYMSQDGGSNYSQKGTVGPEETSYEVGNLAEGEYMFKITQRDEDGNETEGVIANLNLPATGPEMAGLVLFSVAARRLMRRKK